VLLNRLEGKGGGGAGGNRIEECRTGLGSWGKKVRSKGLTGQEQNAGGEREDFRSRSGVKKKGGVGENLSKVRRGKWGE